MKLNRLSCTQFLVALSAMLLLTQQSRAASDAYPTVTDARLEHPDAGDWLMYRRTYDGSGFSPLKQITSSNVGHLTLAWSMSTDLLGAHETTAIVNHGRMFITTPQNNVIALDAKTGTQLWRYARKYPDGLFQPHPTNRGVALYGDYVYMATTDCALVALDAATGKEVWSVALDDYKTGCYSTLAPLAVRGKIIVGYSGGEMGVRGSVSAFDASTGKRIWKTYTVPAPNEPGGDSWKGETYKRGGGSTWITGVYDPATNTTYWGTGNPGPWVGDDRPGDNLYTDSTLALDADTGKIKSYHQYTPHDSFDWDEVSAPLLIDTEVDGKLTKTATRAGRNGYLWILDRDRLKFLRAFPFSNNNVFTSIDPKTGRPTVDEFKRPGAKQGAVPTLPGFGFSDKPTEPGWGLPRIAKAWAELMARLSYSRYVAQGGDWGAGVSTWMAKQRPSGLAAIHLNLPILFPPPPPPAGGYTAAEQDALAHLVKYASDASAYASIQGTRPQTLGYGLADSLVGQAMWIYEKFQAWSDNKGDPAEAISIDRMLDDITLYWLTDSADPRRASTTKVSPRISPECLSTCRSR